MRRLFAIASMAIFLFTSVSASAGDLSKDQPLTMGPPPREAVGPYDLALACISSQLTDSQRKVNFSVGTFGDRTGKGNFVADAGVGPFSTQGLEDMMVTSLSRAGVSVVDFSPGMKANIDYTLGKLAMGRYEPGKGPNLSMAYPDVVINGGITAFDMLPGSGVGITAFGGSLSHQQTRILVTMEGRVSVMVGSSLPLQAGKVIATDRLQKQIVGYEDSVGYSGFVGKKESKTFLSIDLGHKPNEAIQNAEGQMVDRMIFMLLARTFNITNCQAQLEWSDNVAYPQQAQKQKRKK